MPLLKKDAVLINSGRGGIINENDIAEFLTSSTLRFGTDVLEKEPMQKGHPLLNEKIRNRVLITPHIAWAYKSSIEALVAGLVKNIEEFANQK